MLVDDLDVYGHDDNWSVQLRPLTSEATVRPEDKLGVLLQEFSDYTETLSRALHNYICHVLQELLFHDRALFELFRPSSPNEEWEVGPTIGRIPGWSVRRRPWGIFQLAKHSDHGPSWTYLPRHHLLSVTVNRRTLRLWHAAVRHLQIRDRQYLKEHDLAAAVSRVPGYDFKLHQQRLNVESIRATRSIGWDGRTLFTSELTVPFRTYRQLRFRWIWATVAEAAVSSLNTVTASPAVFDSDRFEVSTPGLPTAAETEEVIRRLLRGDLTNDAAFDWVMGRRS
ncbi:hypothetical protein GCM10027569_71740 [Flindersiella endophytica]